MQNITTVQISALSTAAATPTQPLTRAMRHMQQLCMFSWNSLPRRRQKGLCPPNTGNPCSDGQLLILTRGAVRKLGSMVVAPHLIVASPSLQLRITCMRANQTQNETPHHTYQDGYYLKKQKISSVGKDEEKLGPLCTAGGNVKWYSCWEKQHGGF